MSLSDLSILCVTKAEPHAFRFLDEMRDIAVYRGANLVIVADGAIAAGRLLDRGFCGVHIVTSAGYIESVLDEALTYCSREYVLRLDDDERCSDAMVKWLCAREYRAADLWKFRRANLWPDPYHYIASEPQWPDFQTRLTRRELAGGRTEMHVVSPYGVGVEAPCILEHHKCLVRSLEDRLRIQAERDALSPGAGSLFIAWNAPEKVPGLEVRQYCFEPVGEVAA